MTSSASPAPAAQPIRCGGPCCAPRPSSSPALDSALVAADLAHDLDEVASALDLLDVLVSETSYRYEARAAHLARARAALARATSTATADRRTVQAVQSFALSAKTGGRVGVLKADAVLREIHGR